MEQNYYQRRLDLAIKTNAPSYGTGSFVKGNILIVGEKPSNPDMDPSVPEQPFCSDKGCSGWLNGLLSREGIDESKLFWVNAYLKDGTQLDLKKIVDELKPSRVIALGTVARRSCGEHGIDSINVYHPQYWKRFRSKERYPLLDVLKLLQK